MCGGGGGGGQQRTPENELASKGIESERYNLAAGVNSQYLPKYVEEAKRDFSHISGGLANADIMSQSKNDYVGAGANYMAASDSQNSLANTRNTAILKARGAAERTRIESTDSALRALNGAAQSAAQGLVASARRESDEAVTSANNRQNTRQTNIAGAVSLAGALGGIGYDMYSRGELFGKTPKRADGGAPVVEAKPVWRK
ncbi:hypothetical protein [Aggregatibacter kilianii]|uniref:hypothetical protein n=1 Tax=Aggregatibacter kilianii TaxID=2025884 RepID=UPI000D6574E3|nr:hypothetical protein [Aggregatibacter kilianii]